MLTVRRRTVKKAELQELAARQTILRGGTYKYFLRGKNAKPTANDFTVATTRHKRLAPYDRALRKFDYKHALNEALDTRSPLIVREYARGAAPAPRTRARARGSRRGDARAAARVPDQVRDGPQVLALLLAGLHARLRPVREQARAVDAHRPVVCQAAREDHGGASSPQNRSRALLV
ncbi:hypothetical protein PINS_up022503 [Pythium insidiosum]|nr:hypothetical protein PINS_up022503 [Pythium insidiosum]